MTEEDKLNEGSAYQNDAQNEQSLNEAFQPNRLMTKINVLKPDFVLP